MKDNNMVYSAMETPDGHILESLHRHMYVTYEDKNGKHYMLDGGNDYIRCSINGDEKFITLYSTDSIELIREKLKRWSSNQNKWILLKNIDPDWLDGIIEHYIPRRMMIGSMEDKFILQYIKEKQYRNLDLELIEE